eukprot:4546730-Prorocentrum_lima.AAC.1
MACMNMRHPKRTRAKLENCVALPTLNLFRWFIGHCAHRTSFNITSFRCNGGMVGRMSGQRGQQGWEKQ